MASLTGHISNATKVVLGKASERGPQDVHQSMKKEGTSSSLKSGDEGKESAIVSVENKVLPQTTSWKDVAKDQPAQSAADNEIITLGSFNKNNSATEENLNPEKPAQGINLEIQCLQRNLSSEASSQENTQVHLQVQACAWERDQILAVLEEKTRENSNLKRENFHMMDVLVAKEVDLVRLQEANTKLCTQFESSGQDMFQDTLQHLSHLIREKDIEIDALNQKCQTLLTILQTSKDGDEVTGVGRSQVEELLRQRDQFQQQVKRMQEWKEHVMTSAQNMQQEATQLQRELQQLHVQDLIHKDKNAKQQAKYTDPIQDWEGNEIRLKTMGKQVAQLQLSLEQLCHSRDLSEGEFDFTVPQPSTQSLPSESADSLKDRKSGVLTESSQLLEQDGGDLRKVLEEKDAMIRTLQEDKQRLSDSIAASADLERKRREETDSEMKQLWNKQDEFQMLLKEKELIIQAKTNDVLSLSDRCTSEVRENELLRQAVINLRERVVHLEADVCTLQEEKGKRVEKCKEREMETQALQETNVQLSMMLREKDSEIVTIKEKALALEHLLKEQEHGNTEQLSQILNALTATQEKTVLTQRERDEAMLLLKRKQLENAALQSQVQHFHEKELSFKKDLERLSHQAVHSEKSYKLQTLMAEERAAQLGMRVSTLEEKLLLASRALEEASQQASWQRESLKEQLHAICKQSEDTRLQLSLSQQQEKQAVQALANMKMVLAEWMAKADHLEGQLLSAHKLQEKVQAALHGKEDQIRDLKKQTAVQQEVLDDLQEKLMNLRSDAEGKVDKSLMKNLFMGYFQTPKAQRPEVFQIIGSTLGIKREAMQVLLNEEKSSGPRWMTRWLGSKSGPRTPLEPNQQSAMPKMSFSELFVKYLDIESHHTLPLLKPSAPDVKRSNAAGRKKPAQNIQLHLQTTLGSTPKKPEVKVGSLSLSLVNPPGPEPGGSGHLLLNAITDVVPTYPPLLLPPGKNAGAGLKDLSKQRMVL